MLSMSNYLLLLLIRSCTALNTYDITYEPSGEIIWQSTSNFTPQVSTSYGTIRLGQVMSIEFDFKYEGRSSSYENQFFRIGAPATTTGCNDQESKYPSMWLKYGSPILDIQFSGDVTCTTKNSLSDYGDLNLNADHHIIIALNNTKISITITGGGVGKTSPYTQSWPRDPTPANLLGNNVSVWWAGDKTVNDYAVGYATFSNIIIKTNIFTSAPVTMPTSAPTSPTYNPTFVPTFAPTTTNPTSTYNPTMSPTSNPTSSPTHNPSTPSPSKQPTNSPTYTPTTSTPTFTYNPTLTPTHNPTDSTTHTLGASTAGPTTENPTNNPTNNPTSQSQPTLSPILSTKMTKYPTPSPVREGVVEGEKSTTISPINNNNKNQNKNNNEAVLIHINEGTIIGVSVGAAILSALLIWAICVLCKKERKSKRQNKKEHVRSNTSSPVVDLYDMEADIDHDVTNINIVNSLRSSEQYLSAAQKSDLYKTAGGPNDNSEFENDGSFFEAYLSDAQREDVLQHKKMTPRAANKGSLKSSPELMRGPTTEDVDELMYIHQEESDDEVVGNMDTPVGYPKDMSPIVHGNTPVVNTADGDGDGNGNSNSNGGFEAVEVVSDEGDDEI